MPPFLAPVVGANDRPLSFKQTKTGYVMIGGGHKSAFELDTGRVALDVEQPAVSARTALDLFPLLAGICMVHAWAGIEGVLPDDLPMIGASRTQRGLVQTFDFCGHGFALGPVAGGIVAQLALDGAANSPIAPPAPDHFRRDALAGRLSILQQTG